MKKIVLTLSLIAISLGFSLAQKFAFVDSEYILRNIPSYQSAKDQLDQLSTTWQKEVEEGFAEVDKLDRNYQSEKVMLSEEMRKKQEEEIMNKLKTAKELQKKYFGKEGELFKKRQELVKPIQDEIFNAVKEIASEGGYAVIFDIAGGGATMLYTDSKFDKSDEVLQKLGYKN